MTDDERFERIKLCRADNSYIPHTDEGFLLAYAEAQRDRADRLAAALEGMSSAWRGHDGFRICLCCGNSWSNHTPACGVAAALAAPAGREVR